MNDDLDRSLTVALIEDDNMDRKRLDPPRWAGGPPICQTANLPAFPSQESALAWLNAPKRTNPQYIGEALTKIWACEHCGQWHFLTKPRDPSGDSSGTGRSSKNKRK